MKKLFTRQLMNVGFWPALLSSYKKWFGLVLVLCIILLTASCVDPDMQNEPDTSISSLAGSKAGFALPATVYMDTVKLYLDKGNFATGTFTIEILRNDSLVKSTIYPVSSIAAGSSWKTFTFAQPLPLVSGTKYKISVSRSDPHNYSSGNYIFWRTSSYQTNPYPDGSNDVGPSYWNLDYAFKTYSNGVLDQEQTSFNYGFWVGHTFSRWQEFVPAFVAIPPTNVWDTIADFGGEARDNVGIAFVINGKGYTGGAGQNAANTNLKDFWEYNPQTDIWTQKADFAGAARNGAASFAIGSKGYVGTGYRGGSLNDFWEYNPATNNWTQKANFAGISRSGAAGFSIGNEGYIGTGVQGGFLYLNDFWKYDPATDSWIQVANFGGAPRAFTSSFVAGSKGYVGNGQKGTGASPRDFWEYNPASDAWTQKIDYPTIPRNGQAFAINSKGYVIGGSQIKELWEYNAVTNNWSRKADLPAAIYSGVAFAIGGYGYVGLGSNQSYTKSNKFYRYTPE